MVPFSAFSLPDPMIDRISFVGVSVTQEILFMDVLQLLPKSGATSTPIPTSTPSTQSLPPSAQTTVPGCITPNYAGSGVNISWTTINPAVSYVDISTSSTFASGVSNKATQGALSVSGPSGFIDYPGNTVPLTLNPNTQYFVRLYNAYGADGHGPTTSFTIPACSTPTPVPTKTASPTPLPTNTPIPAGKVGDIDGNGKVDIFDYNILVTNFGKSGSGIQGDIDGNGKVDIFDYNLLVGNFGK